MNAKKSSAGKDLSAELKPRLTISRAEADERITAQIEKGQQLLVLTIKTYEGLNEARNEYYTWHEFNKSLLSVIFDTSQKADEYGHIGPSVAYLDETLRERIEDYTSDVKEKIRRLKSIKEQLSLYAEPSKTPKEKTDIGENILTGTELRLLVQQCDDLMNNLGYFIRSADTSLVENYTDEYEHLLNKATQIEDAQADVSALVKEFDKKFNVSMWNLPPAMDRLKMLVQWVSRLYRIVETVEIATAGKKRKPQEFYPPVSGGGGRKSTLKTLPQAPKTAEKESIIYDYQPPIEIQESLDKFRKDFPESNKVAFIMMEFVETDTHREILEAIKSVLNSHSIVGIRADDKEYHTDLYYNVLTYVYGCGFGIAVYERIEEERFNPNVSLEVGYMLALRKNVCLLKDRTLKTLYADLIGKIYRIFDPQHVSKTIGSNLNKWLREKGIAK